MQSTDQIETTKMIFIDNIYIYIYIYIYIVMENDYHFPFQISRKVYKLFFRKKDIGFWEILCFIYFIEEFDTGYLLSFQTMRMKIEKWYYLKVSGLVELFYSISIQMNRFFIEKSYLKWKLNLRKSFSSQIKKIQIELIGMRFDFGFMFYLPINILILIPNMIDQQYFKNSKNIYHLFTMETCEYRCWHHHKKSIT